MYEKFYDLAKNPFSLTPDASLFFMSDAHDEALSRIIYGVRQNRGLIVLTGEVGAGKTTVIRKFLQEIGPNYDVVLIFNTFLSPRQLIESILIDLDIPYKERDSKMRLIRRLYDYMISARRQGKYVVLIVDEAQNLSSTVLEEIRMLTNLETQTEKLLQIVLVGQPELKDILSSANLRQLRQRVFLHYHLTPLSLEDSIAYIHHRIVRCGGVPNQIFTAEAVEAIARSSLGVPRVINVLADNCLVTGFAKEEKPVGVMTVEEVIKEMGYPVKIGESLWEE